MLKIARKEERRIMNRRRLSYTSDMGEAGSGYERMTFNQSGNLVHPFP
jgi:hypothetical protein